MFDSPRNHTPQEGIATLSVIAYGEHDGMGMGLLSNGEAYLTQRGLAHLCGVQNAHIGSISRDWHEDKPRINLIRERLARNGAVPDLPHRVLSFDGHRLYCYDLAVCQAVLDYYAVDAGQKAQGDAQENRIKYRGDGLRNFIRSQMGPFQAPDAPGPLRFFPVSEPVLESVEELWTASIAHIWSLYIMSFWLAIAYVDTLRQKAAQAQWNRLGLYLPLKAILEIQAEMIATFWAGKAAAASDEAEAA
ncbi:MAG TPA: hypothetical protein VG839_07625 [Asticcacaulis sp.]|nr:hypothetical protein [Asticcacaulis sp.]